MGYTKPEIKSGYIPAHLEAMISTLRQHPLKVFLFLALLIFIMLILWITSIKVWDGQIIVLMAGVTFVAIILLWIIFMLSREMAPKKVSEKPGVSFEDRYRAMWDQSPDGMRIMDRFGRITMVNAAYCKLKRQSAEQIMNEGETGAPFEIEKMPKEQILHRNKGEEVCVEISHAEINASKDEKLILSIFRDVSERKKLEEELHEAQKMDALGRFALEIANNFNNIVGIILNAAEILRSKYSDDNTGKQFLEMIIAHANRGGVFANELLVFTRSQNTEEREVSIPKCLEHSQKMLEHLIPSSVSVSLSLGDNDAVVMGDMYETSQAVINIGVSATERMTDGGKISITSFLIGEDDARLVNPKALEMQYVVVMIHDNGIPLTEEQRRTIFEPHFSPKEHQSGTGLRMAVVYSIAKRQYGFVRVESDEVNGTTFSLYFPVARHGEIAFEVVASHHPKEGKNLVLIVDDEDAYLVLYEREFLSNGYSVMTAKDGEEALRIYNQYGPLISLVVTDITMPKLNGEELFKQLIARNSDIKVIFATGNIDAKSRTELLNLGVKGIVEKPFTFAELMSTVQQVLEE
ncbi:MAG: response regulator [Bacteroidota bacterium]|nr:response regulator [Bacteroidota bacterium]